MQIKSLLTLGRTQCDAEASSKRTALEVLANVISRDIPALDADDLLRRFLARERLGSTGIGHGIAIPHCRISNSESTGTGAIGALITLTQPISFDGIDGEPVDILFAMLVPDDAHDEHLKNLAALASALHNTAFRQRLRDAKDNNTLYDAAVGSEN